MDLEARAADRQRCQDFYARGQESEEERVRRVHFPQGDVARLRTEVPHPQRQGLLVHLVHVASGDVQDFRENAHGGRAHGHHAAIAPMLIRGQAHHGEASHAAQQHVSQASRAYLSPKQRELVERAFSGPQRAPRSGQADRADSSAASFLTPMNVIEQEQERPQHSLERQPRYFLVRAQPTRYDQRDERASACASRKEGGDFDESQAGNRPDRGFRVRRLALREAEGCGSPDAWDSAAAAVPALRSLAVTASSTVHPCDRPSMAASVFRRSWPSSLIQIVTRFMPQQYGMAPYVSREVRC